MADEADKIKEFWSMRPARRFMRLGWAIEISMAFFYGVRNMKKYIKSISALNEVALSPKYQNEVERFAESDIFWASRKQKPTQNRTIKKGEIYQFEFGKNYVPEMSYEHRGLVIGTSGKRLLYVLPICSYKPADIPEHAGAIHPIDNPNSSSNFFLLKSSDFPFLPHDSVLKLNDLRSVSTARIKYQQSGAYIDPSSDTYKAIEYHAFSRHFPVRSYQYSQLKKQNEQLLEELGSLQ